MRVLRLCSGAPIVLFNGRGGEYPATLSLGAGYAAASVAAFDPAERESPLELTLLQALVAADKLDWVVEKSVELGVHRILVTPMTRSVARLDPARSVRRLQHWRDLVIAACCQCGRNRLPSVDYAASLDAALTVEPEVESRLLLSPSAATDLPSNLPGGRAVLMVGPEGGVTDAELKHAERAGFAPVRLGPRILRAETAGLAALASFQALGGDFATKR